jgi:hypothetical protein
MLAIIRKQVQGVGKEKSHYRDVCSMTVYWYRLNFCQHGVRYKKRRIFFNSGFISVGRMPD